MCLCHRYNMRVKFFAFWLSLEEYRMTTRKAKLKEKKVLQIRLLLASQVVYDWPCNLIAAERTLWTWKEKKPPSKE